MIRLGQGLGLGTEEILTQNQGNKSDTDAAFEGWYRSLGSPLFRELHLKDGIVALGGPCSETTFAVEGTTFAVEGVSFRVRTLSPTMLRNPA